MSAPNGETLSAYEAMQIARLRGQIAALREGARISERHRLRPEVADPTGRVASEAEKLQQELDKARTANVLLRVQRAEAKAQEMAEQEEPVDPDPEVAKRVGRTWRLVGDLRGAPVATRGLVHWVPRWEHIRYGSAEDPQ